MVRADLESLQSAINQLEDSAQQQQASLDGQQNASSGNFEAVRSRLAELDSRFGKLAIDLDDLICRQVKELPREITSEIVTQIEALEREVRSISEVAERQQSQSVSSVKEVVNAVTLLESRIARLDKQVDQLRSDIETGNRSIDLELSGKEEAVQALSEVDGIGEPTAIKLYSEQITTVLDLAELPEQRIDEVRRKLPRIKHLIRLARRFLGGEAGGPAMA